MEWEPLWAKGHIEKEILVFVEEDGKITAHLAFNSPKNIVIRDRNGKTLTENSDYVVEGNRIVLRNRSLPFFRAEWLKNENVPDEIENENERYQIGGALLVSPAYLYRMQFLADYDCSYTEFPNVSADRMSLSGTYRKLSERKPFRLVLFGDSISNAANSSLDMGVTDYEHWMESARKNIEQIYGAPVNVSNISRSGYGIDWALSAYRERLEGIDPDLVVIAFGMNDYDLPAALFADRVRQLIDGIREMKSDAEFILVATPLPNGDCYTIAKSQSEQYGKLKELEGEGVTVVNMTAVTEFLLQRKRYVEISGNNLNHPNDFFYACYTDIFSELFVRLKQRAERRLAWNEGFFQPQKFEEVPFDALPKNIHGGYLVNEVNGNVRKTFAFYGVPTKNNGNCPAVVLVHGAGGNAFWKWVDSWTERGYAAIAIDINCTEFSGGDLSERKQNPSAGELNIGAFAHVGKDPYDSWIYYSVAEVIAANSFLRSLACVDSGKIGLVGISWGGVVSLIALSVDSRFAVGGIIYSAGFITEDLLGRETGMFENYQSKTFYDDYFDPRNYVKEITAPVVFHAGMSDGAFSPISRKRTADLIASRKEYAILKDLLHDNESNFGNRIMFESFDRILHGSPASVSLKAVTVCNGKLCGTVQGDPTDLRLIWSADDDDIHSVSWKETEIDVLDGRFEVTLDPTTKYAVVTAFYGDGLYTSSRVFIFRT